MIEVSPDFMEKSLSPGRDVQCVILAGGHAYDDKDILSFEFNDVVHPEDMSFGTTCANRFHFELWSRRNIPLSAVISPYVAFTKDASGAVTEFRLLGEFYISRRYRKRERYSITCYDKMFRLDARYRPTVNFPCTTAELLSDIAEQHDFKVGFATANDVVESVPKLATCREVIGYIAGINGGFAKFDRTSVLRLRKLELCDFLLNRSQYTSLSLKADKLEVRQIEFMNEDETFSEGKGTKLTTYRQHNPFAGKDAAKRVFDQWNGFTYFGMTVKMQGLPFLESGFSILVQDDFENIYYVALISDYTLEYDGALRATLVSKSKNPIDDYEEPMTQQRLMESLSQSLRMRYYNFINERIVTISQSALSIISINFSLETSSVVVFNSQFTVTANTDAVLTLNYYVNNINVGQQPRTNLSANKPLSVSLYNCFERARTGRNTLSVTASISAGNAVIEQGQLIATVSGQYMLGDAKPQIPEINISEAMTKHAISALNLRAVELSETLGIPPVPDTKVVIDDYFEKLSISGINLSLK
ncbi:MAG: hypothetical protein FWH08_03210 [Oscillospiraceae bacterium]|nr:hypothetical protein [Oscillospiraceae bacterium]